MKLHLYQLNKEEAFRLSKEALHLSGFTIHLADAESGLITASKQAKGEHDVLFFNILFTDNMPCATLQLISNIFSGNSGTFVAVKGFDESFCECLHLLINKTQVKNTAEQPEEEYAVVEA